MRPPLIDEDSVVLCQALYQSIEEEWTEMHERLQELCWKVRVKKAGQRIAGLGRVAWRKTEKEPFSSAKKGLGIAVNRRSALRESLSEAWNVDTHKALRICEEQHVTVEGSEGSYVSLGRVNGPWQVYLCQMKCPFEGNTSVAFWECERFHD